MEIRKVKRCPNCNHLIPADYDSCPYCNGYSFHKTEPQSDLSESTQKEEQSFSLKKRFEEDPNLKKTVIIALSALFALLIVVGAVCLVSSALNDSNKSTEHVDYDIAEDSESQYNDKAEDSEEQYNDNVEYAEEEENIDGPIVQLDIQSASAQHAHDGGVNYYASNLIDGSIRTCWALDVRNQDAYQTQGFGPIHFTLDCRKLDHIVVYNGYQKNDNVYWGNPRAMGVIIYNADDMSEPILDSSLQDSMEGQTLYAGQSSLNRDITNLVMFFPSEFYTDGNRWNDLSISEIEFYGIK